MSRFINIEQKKKWERNVFVYWPTFEEFDPFLALTHSRTLLPAIFISLFFTSHSNSFTCFMIFHLHFHWMKRAMELNFTCWQRVCVFLSLHFVCIMLRKQFYDIRALSYYKLTSQFYLCDTVFFSLYDIQFKKNETKTIESQLSKIE